MMPKKDKETGKYDGLTNNGAMAIIEELKVEKMVFKLPKASSLNARRPVRQRLPNGVKEEEINPCSDPSITSDDRREFDKSLEDSTIDVEPNNLQVKSQPSETNMREGTKANKPKTENKSRSAIPSTKQASVESKASGPKTKSNIIKPIIPSTASSSQKIQSPGLAPPATTSKVLKSSAPTISKESTTLSNECTTSKVLKPSAPTLSKESTTLSNERLRKDKARKNLTDDEEPKINDIIIRQQKHRLKRSNSVTNDQTLCSVDADMPELALPKIDSPKDDSEYSAPAGNEAFDDTVVDDTVVEETVKEEGTQQETEKSASNGLPNIDDLSPEQLLQLLQHTAARLNGSGTSQEQKSQIIYSIRKILNVGAPGSSLTKTVKEADILNLCEIAINDLLKQPSLIEIDPPIRICGDTHGQNVEPTVIKKKSKYSIKAYGELAYNHQNNFNIVFLNCAFNCGPSLTTVNPEKPTIFRCVQHSCAGRIWVINFRPNEAKVKEKIGITSTKDHSANCIFNSN